MNKNTHDQGIEMQSSSENTWHQERDSNNKAFATLKLYIQENIIENGEVHLLVDINNYYQVILNELSGDDSRQVLSAAHKLEKKLLKEYTDKPKIEKGKTRRGNIVFSSLMTTKEALRKQHSSIHKR